MTVSAGHSVRLFFRTQEDIARFESLVAQWVEKDPAIRVGPDGTRLLAGELRGRICLLALNEARA